MLHLCCFFMAALSVPAPRQAASHRLQHWPGSAPVRALHMLCLLQGNIHCCSTGSSMAAQADLTLVVPVGRKGMACSSIGLTWAAECCCSTPGALPALTVAAVELILSCFLTPLSQLLFNRALPEHIQHDVWLRSGSSRSLLELALT